MNHVLQRLPGGCKRAVVYVLARQLEPVLDLLRAALAFDFDLQRQGFGVGRVKLQNLLQFLQGQGVFLFRIAAPGGFEQLGDGLAAQRLVDAPGERPDGRVQVPLGLDLAQDLGGKIEFPFLERLLGALDARDQPLRIEALDGLVVQSLLQRLGELARVLVAAERLFRHRRVDHLAQARAHRRIQLRRRWRRVVENRPRQIFRRTAGERMPPRQSFKAGDAQRVDIGLGSRGLVLHLFGRHVEQRASGSAGRGAAGERRHAEVDDLDRIVLQNEKIAGLEIAMDQSVLVRGVQPAAGLRDDFDRAIHAEPLGRVFDQRIERGPFEQRHDEVRAALAFLFELAHVVNVDDVRMVERRQHRAFPAEQLERGWVGRIENGLQRHVPAQLTVKGAVDDAHPAPAQNGSPVVTVFDSRRRSTHGPFFPLRFIGYQADGPGGIGRRPDD